jgi:NADH-quinone oxidoreductase subunit C
MTAKTAFGQTIHHVELADWLGTATRHHAEGCVMFDWLGVEDAGRPGASGQRHAVFLHVIDPRTREGVMLRTELGETDSLPSVAHLWKGARWHEREAAEMFGITVEAESEHLLLPDSFEGHPLRKDFVLASRVVRPWPGRPRTRRGQHERPESSSHRPAWRTGPFVGPAP